MLRIICRMDTLHVGWTPAFTVNKGVSAECGKPSYADGTAPTCDSKQKQYKTLRHKAFAGRTASFSAF